ncbi:MAG TPA: disulfide bond formation protein B [Paenalcaligenes sp.]|nr:disulfide bond formation protein B [Paenalcaligenes sp.]
MSAIFKFPRAQKLFLCIALFALAALATALFAQHVLGMMPCAWCVFQRLILILCLCFAVLATLLSPMTQRGLSLLCALLLLGSALGGIVAAWHQYTVAAHSFSCAQTFADKAMHWLGLEQGLPALFGIYASCMDAQVNFLGLDFALWALLAFGLVSLASLFAIRALLTHPR